jgi:site-specific recombinase XerD
MRVKNYSELTIRLYSKYVGDMLSNFNKDAYHINNKEIIFYLENLNYSSISLQNQIISSVKSFCELILKRKIDRIKIERPRKEKKLPRVIDANTIITSLEKHLGNKTHMHLLRHSCFTTLLENGTDIRIIQKLAGHKNIKTTQIYAHVSTNLLKNVQLPI